MRRAGPALAAIGLCACHSSPPAPLPPAPVFGAPVTASDVTGAAQAEPALVADSAGNLVVAWMDWRTGHPHIRVALSSDGGQRFSASRLLLATDAEHPVGEADPSLVRTDSGRIWIGWEGCRLASEAPERRACDVYAAWSDDRGRSFSSPLAVAVGGEIRRDRPWLATDGREVYASWTDEVVGPPTWRLAHLAGNAFVEVASLPLRTGVLPVAPHPPSWLEALVGVIGAKDASRIHLERKSSPDGGKSFATDGTIEVWASAVLFEYSIAALAVGHDGESWLLIPDGDGMANDFAAAHRAAGEEVYVTAGKLRGAAAGRVVLPTVAPVGGGRFLAAWMEQETQASLWRTRARLLGPGTRRSAPADVSGGSFPLVDASLKLKPGDFLSIAAAGGRAWVAWSDPRDGESKVRVASTTLATTPPTAVYSSP